MFLAREQALAREKALTKGNTEATREQDKAARKQKVRVGEKLRAVNAIRQPPTAGEANEAAESLIKGKIKSLAMMNSTLNTMNVAARVAKRGTDEQDASNTLKAAAKVKGLTRFNLATHAAERRDHAEPSPVAGPDFHRRAASATGRQHYVVDDVFFELFLQNQLNQLNRFGARPYKIDRAGPAFSCKAHLRNRFGHFSFGLLAGLGTRKKKMQEEPPHNPHHDQSCAA